MNSVFQNKNILVIDAEQFMLDIVKVLLKREGAIPTGAHMAQKGLELAKSHVFHAIILDRYMEDGDGNDVLQELKTFPKTRDVPVIMLTGEKDRFQIMKSIQLGAVGYIVKPFKPSDFLNQLEKLLERDVIKI